MLFLALFAAAIGQPAPAAPPARVPAEERESRFGSLFVDWRVTADEALRNEQARAEGAGAPAPERQARVLGDQVGEMVALGDCDGGERLAREAGDPALVRAVQDYCRRRQTGGVLAGSTAVPE